MQGSWVVWDSLGRWPTLQVLCFEILSEHNSTNLLGTLSLAEVKMCASWKNMSRCFADYLPTAQTVIRIC
jgi:hypothetical protein